MAKKTKRQTGKPRRAKRARGKTALLKPVPPEPMPAEPKPPESESTEPERKRKPRLTLKGLPPAEQVARLSEEITRVRQREEARLIRTANKVGYFDRPITNADLMKRLRPEADTSLRDSQLKKLETRMTKIKRKATEEKRRRDTRRKILLGSFLIAQVDHKPEIKTLVQDELAKFLDQHRDAKVAANNKALLADYLG